MYTASRTHKTSNAECGKRRPLVVLTLLIGGACAATPSSPQQQPPAPDHETGDPVQQHVCTSEGPDGTRYEPGINCRTITVDGYPRSFIVYVPPNHSRSPRQLPVVFMFHGSGGTGERFLRISGWREKADEVGLIAVFPTALQYRVLDRVRPTTKWHNFKLLDEIDAGVRPPDYPADAPWPADDVTFVRQMLNDVENLLPVDGDQIYASGFSNGAGFTARLSVELADRLRAVAYVAGGLPERYDVKTDGPPPAVLQAVGSRDARVLEAVAGDGISSLPMSAEELLAVPGIAAAVDIHVTTFHLADTPYQVRTLPGVTHLIWTTPAERTLRATTYQLAVLEDMEHVYPNGKNNPRNFVAADRFWEFFQQSVSVEN